MVSIHNIVTEVKNAFDWLISRLDIAEEGISMLEGLSVSRVLENLKQREQRLQKKQNKISNDCGITTKDVIYV